MFVIILLGLLIYAGTFFSGFFLDDIGQIAHLPPVHSLSSIPALFHEVLVFPVHSGLTQYYYKPLMFVFFTFLYAIGKGNPFPFHLFLVMYHITNTVLLFMFFSKIWRVPDGTPLWSGLPFFLSLLFLIHPVSNDVARYNSNLQDALFFFFGMLALLTSSPHFFTLISTAILLLLSILSKETGILFFFIILLYIFLFQRKALPAYFFTVSVTLLLYSYLRLNASHHQLLYLAGHTIQQANFQERLKASVTLQGFSLQELLLPQLKFPLYLKTQTIPFLQFISYLFELVLFVCGIVLGGAFLRKKDAVQFRYFVFFSIWLFSGILFHSQLFFSLDVFVALRWLYFPLAGMLGVAGAFLTAYANSSFINSKRVTGVFAGIALLYAWETLYTMYFLPS